MIKRNIVGIWAALFIVHVGAAQSISEWVLESGQDTLGFGTKVISDHNSFYVLNSLERYNPGPGIPLEGTDFLGFDLIKFDLHSQMEYKRVFRYHESGARARSFGKPLISGEQIVLPFSSDGGYKAVPASVGGAIALCYESGVYTIDKGSGELINRQLFNSNAWLDAYFVTLHPMDPVKFLAIHSSDGERFCDEGRNCQFELVTGSLKSGDLKVVGKVNADCTFPYFYVNLAYYNEQENAFIVIGQDEAKELHLLRVSSEGSVQSLAHSLKLYHLVHLESFDGFYWLATSNNRNSASALKLNSQGEVIREENFDKNIVSMDVSDAGVLVILKDEHGGDTFYEQVHLNEYLIKESKKNLEVQFYSQPVVKWLDSEEFVICGNLEQTAVDSLNRSNRLFIRKGNINTFEMAGQNSSLQVNNIISVRIEPNPALSDFRLSWETDISDVLEGVIYNLRGETVSTFEIVNGSSLKNDLSPGSYIIELRSGELREAHKLQILR